MHYELAPWLPALCSQVPALAGCCDTSCAVNTLVQVGVSSLICCVCVQIVSLPWCTGSFSKHFGSLLHTGWDSSLLTPALLLPLTVNSLPPGSSFQGWQGISASQSLPKALQEVWSCRGDRDQEAVSAVQPVRCWALELSLIRGRRAPCCSPVLKLILEDPGHNIHIMHSLFVTIFDA